MRILNAINISLINAMLAQQSSIRRQLQACHNQCYRIMLHKVSILTFTIDKDGFFEAVAATDEHQPYDATIVIPSDIVVPIIYKQLTSRNDQQDKIAIAKQLHITGNEASAYAMLEAIANLDTSAGWLYATCDSSKLSWLLCKQLIGVLTWIKDGVNRVTSNVIYSSVDYWQNQVGAIVAATEIEEFCQAVDIVKARTDVIVRDLQLLRQYIHQKK
jgi:ubiquinone biosynthesis protein UbiJ